MSASLRPRGSFVAIADLTRLVSVTLSGRKIVTTRHYSDEWTATEDEWDLGMPTGSGKTEAEAIADLLEQIEERT